MRGTDLVELDIELALIEAGVLGDVERVTDLPFGDDLLFALRLAYCAGVREGALRGDKIARDRGFSLT